MKLSTEEITEIFIKRLDDEMFVAVAAEERGYYPSKDLEEVNAFVWLGYEIMKGIRR